MNLRMATVLCLVGLVSPAVGQIHNNGNKVWQVRYEPSDIVAAKFPHAVKSYNELNIKIALTGDDADEKESYTIDVETKTGASSVTYTGLTIDDWSGSPVATKHNRVAFKTVPRTIGPGVQFQLYAIWHPGRKGHGNSHRPNNTLHARMVYLLGVDGKLKSGDGDCDEEPDTDVLEEEAP